MCCLAGAFLLVAVFIRLNTALTVKREGEEVVVPDGRAVAHKYVRSGAVLTDLLTILPTVLQVIYTAQCHAIVVHFVGLCNDSGRNYHGVLPRRIDVLLQL